MWDRIRSLENALAASPRLRAALIAAARGEVVPEREAARLRRLGLLDEDGLVTEDGKVILVTLGIRAAREAGVR